jgi:hypothetical protein
MRRDRPRVTMRWRHASLGALASVALAACSSGGSAPANSPYVEATPRPPAGLEARLRSLGSAVTGKVRVIDRNDGVSVLVSLANVPSAQYRIAFNAVPNCSSPNGFSAGPRGCLPAPAALQAT